MVQRGEVATLNLVREGRRAGLARSASPTRCASSTRSTTRCGCRSCTAASAGSPSPTSTSRRCRTPPSSASTCVPTARRASSPSSEDVELRLYEVIYQVLEDVQQRARRHAQARVRGGRHRRGRGPRGLLASRASARSPVASCSNGVITRGSKVRFLRDGDGHLEGRDRVAAALQGRRPRGPAGFECGIGLENYQDLKQGDVIETYELKEIART